MSDSTSNFSDLYYHELERRHNLINRLQVYYIAYIALATSLIYMARMADGSASFLVTFIFAEMLFSSVSCFAISLKDTVSSMSVHEYKVLAKPTEILEFKKNVVKYNKEMKRWNEENEEDRPLLDVERKVNDLFEEQYSKGAELNFAVNENRSQLLRNALSALVASGALAATAAIIFVAFNLDASSPKKVSTSFENGSPLVEALDKLSFVSLTHLNVDSKMSKDDKANGTSEKMSRPPSEEELDSKKPEMQTSLEDYNKRPDKDKRQLNEDK